MTSAVPGFCVLIALGLDLSRGPVGQERLHALRCVGGGASSRHTGRRTRRRLYSLDRTSPGVRVCGLTGASSSSVVPRQITRALLHMLREGRRQAESLAYPDPPPAAPHTALHTHTFIFDRSFVAPTAGNPLSRTLEGSGQRGGEVPETARLRLRSALPPNQQVPPLVLHRPPCPKIET